MMILCGGTCNSTSRQPTTVYFGFNSLEFQNFLNVVIVLYMGQCAMRHLNLMQGDVQFHFKTPYYYTAHDATLTCMGRGGVGVAEDAWDREDWSQDAQKLELVEILKSPLAAGSTVEKNCRAGF